MHYDYVIAGNVMLDRVIFLDGSQSGREHIGGPATFAYSGVRLWTDSVMQCSNVGADWETLFVPWIEKNKVETCGFKVITDRCNHSIMKYKDKSGAYAFEPSAHIFANTLRYRFGYVVLKSLCLQFLLDFSRYSSCRRKDLYIGCSYVIVRHVYLPVISDHAR